MSPSCVQSSHVNLVFVILLKDTICFDGSYGTVTSIGNYLKCFISVNQLSDFFLLN